MSKYFNYDDRQLIDYLPNVLKEVREFQAIMYAEQIELYDIFNEAENILDNQFIMSLTEYGCQRWEKMLKIVLKPGLTLSERRFAILTRLGEHLPYTIRMLRRMLTVLCGEDGYILDVREDIDLLNVKVALTAVSKFDEVGRMLHRVVPADFIIDLAIQYNQHFLLKPYTHKQLNSITHYQIRNEVLSL